MHPRIFFETFLPLRTALRAASLPATNVLSPPLPAGCEFRKLVATMNVFPRPHRPRPIDGDETWYDTNSAVLISDQGTLQKLCDNRGCSGDQSLP